MGANRGKLIRTLQRLTVLAIVLVALSFGLNLIVDNPYTHSIVRKLINEKLKSYSGLRLDFRALKIKAVPLGIDLFGFEVTSSEDVQKRLVKASQLRIRASIWSILLGSPRLGLIEVKDLEFEWPLDPVLQKALGLDKPSEPSEPLKWPLPIAQLPLEVLELKNARVYFELPPLNPKTDTLPALAMSLSQFDLRADVSDLHDIDVVLKAGQVNLSSDKFNILQNASIETEIVIGPDRIRKSPIRVAMHDIEANGILSGKIKTNSRTNVLEHISLESSVNAKGQLDVLGRILNIDNTNGGVEGEGKITLEIPLESSKKVEFLAAVNAQAKDGRIDNFRLRDSKARMDIDLDQLKILEGTLIVGDKNYGDFAGSIAFNKEISIDFTGKPKELPLSVLLDAVKVENFDVFDAKITSPDLRVKGAGDPLKLKVSATGDFDEFEIGAMRGKVPTTIIKPSCRSLVALDISNKRVAFDGSQLNCFTRNPKAERGAIPVGSLTAPLDSQHSSMVFLNGVATYDKTTGIDLGISSPQLDLRIADGLINQNTQGIVSVNAKVKGPYDKIAVSADFTGNDAYFRSLALGTVSGFVNFVGKRLEWSNISGRLKEGGRIGSKTGNLTIEEPMYISSEFEVSGISETLIADFLKGLEVPSVSFAIPSAKGAVRGPLTKPMLYTGNATIDLQNLKIKNETFFDDLHADIKADDAQLNIKKATITLKDLSLETNATINKVRGKGVDRFLGFTSADTFIATFKTSDQSKTVSRAMYDHLQIIPFVKTYATTAQLGGQIVGSGSVSGTIDQYEVESKLSLVNGRFLGSKISPVNVFAKTDSKNLHLDVTQSAKSLDAKIDIDLTKNTLPYSWEIKANRMDVRAIASKYFSQDPRNYAYLSANWTMKGEFTNWWKSSGNLALQDIRMRFTQDTRTDVGSIDLALSEPLQMTMGASGWVFQNGKPLVLSNEQIKLKISTADNRPPERLDMDMQGTFGVEVLKSFIPELETATGSVLAEASLSGSVNDPTFNLRLRNEPGAGVPISFGLTSIRPAFNNVNFDMRVSDDALVINSFSAEKGKGRVTASGQIVYASNTLETSRIDVTMINASFFSQVSVLKTFESELSGSLSITGNKLPLTVAGDIQIARARSTKNFDLREQIVNTLKRKTFEQGSTVNTADPIINLDLRVNANQSIAIYNRNIQTVLSSNLNITGTNVAPVITGQIEVNNGSFAYKYRRDFRITQGIITFDDPVRLDPRLDILAVSETAGYRVFMAITGRASDPKVDLSIDPPSREDGTPLTKVDILVLLSTGSLPDRQRTGIATQDAAKAEALNLLVGQFEEPVERIFDMSGQTVVQQVYIDSYAGPDGTPTARLNLPLNVHQDWDVIFRVDNVSQRLSVGYRIDDKVSLSGSLDRQSKEENTRQTTTSEPTDTGVDLKFRFSFP